MAMAKTSLWLYCFIMDLIKRDIIFKLANDDFRAFPIIHALDSFVHSEKIFRFLISQGITGPKLVELHDKNFKRSWLNLGRWVIMCLRNEKTLPKVYAGKDVKTSLT